MPFIVVFLPSAKSDLRLASDWYEKKQNGLGRRFKGNVINAIDSLSIDSIREYGPVYLSLARIFVNSFPYVIYFKKDLIRQRIVIYGVLHEKQNKEDILKRRV